MQNSMKTISRRLRRLERQFGLEEETWEEKALWARLEAARLRCVTPPPSPERRAGSRGMSIVDILNAGRQRAAVGARLAGKPAEGLI